MWKWFIMLTLALSPSVQALTLTDQEALETGKRIWQNECGGSVAGLTSWNAGEEFPSLGIGHFIWYPSGYRGRFEESFPGLVVYLRAQGVEVPTWLDEKKGCPWKSRSQFLQDLQGPQLSQLRRILASSVAHQARYIANRLEAALPKILQDLPPERQVQIRKRFDRVASSPGGIYALVDYVNFKGEGINPNERYHGQGWGLRQVLESMSDSGDPIDQFIRSADRMLTLRVRNSPSQRGEQRWLQGWRNRLQTYR